MNSENKQIIVYGGTGYYGRKVVEKHVIKDNRLKL